MHSQNCEKWLLASSSLFICPSARNNLAPTAWIFMKFDIWLFLKDVKNIQFLITYRSILLRMGNVSDKCCRGSQNTHFVFSNFFFEKVPFEIKWKNIWTGNRWQYGTFTLHAGYLRLQTHTQNILTFTHQIKSHLLFAGIIRSSPYSPRFQDKG
jgi:hypothetical protein